MQKDLKMKRFSDKFVWAMIGFLVTVLICSVSYSFHEALVSKNALVGLSSKQLALAGLLACFLFMVYLEKKAGSE